MTWLEAVGYVASILVLSTFYMKTMLPLRCCAIASNIAFIAYGFFGEIYPVFVLHLVLLPLNIKRLHELRQLTRGAAHHGVDPYRGVADGRHRFPSSRPEGQAIRVAPLVDRPTEILAGERGIEGRQALGQRRLVPQVARRVAVRGRRAAAVGQRPAEDEPDDSRHRQGDEAPLQEHACVPPFRRADARPGR